MILKDHRAKQVYLINLQFKFVIRNSKIILLQCKYFFIQFNKTLFYFQVNDYISLKAIMKRYPISQNNTISFSQLTSTSFGRNRCIDQIGRQKIKQNKQSKKSLQKMTSKITSISNQKLKNHKNSELINSIHSKLSKKYRQENNQLHLQTEAKFLFMEIQNIMSNQQFFWTKHQVIRINKWLKILNGSMYNQVWSQNRNLYLKVLLIMLQNEQISEPFCNIPQDGPLPKLNYSSIPYSIKQKLQEKYQKKYQNVSQKSLKKSLEKSIKKSISCKKRFQEMNSNNKLHINKNFQDVSNYEKKCPQEQSKKRSNHKFSSGQSIEDSMFEQHKQNNINYFNRDQFKNKKYNRQYQKRKLTKNLQSISFKDSQENIQKQQNVYNLNLNNFLDGLFLDQRSKTPQSTQNYHNQSQFQTNKHLSRFKNQLKEQNQAKKMQYNFPSKNYNLILKTDKFNHRNYSTMKTNNQQKFFNFQKTNVLKNGQQQQKNEFSKENNEQRKELQAGMKILSQIERYLVLKQKTFNENMKYISLVQNLRYKINDLSQKINRKEQKSKQRQKQRQISSQYKSMGFNLREKLSITGKQTMEFLNFLGTYNFKSH